MDEKFLKLLVIEDDPGDLFYIEELLGESVSSFLIESADNLKEGLEMLKEKSFHTVLLDLSLPDSRGLHTFNVLNNAFPEVPAVILTGLDDEEVAVKALRTGAQDYLVKGKINSELLVRTIKYAMKRHELRLEIDVNLCEEKKSAAVQKKLHYRLLMEELVSDMSSRFINIAFLEFDREIKEALRLVGEFVEAKRSFLVKFYDDGTKKIHQSYEWFLDGLKPEADRYKGMHIEPFLFSLGKEEPEKFYSNLTSLNSEDIISVEMPEQPGVHPFIIPLFLRKTLTGMFGFILRKEENIRKRENIRLLKMAGDVFVNVLERKRADEELRERKERLKTIMNFVQAGIILVDAETFIIREVNPAAAEMIGTSADKIKGAACYKYICPAEKGDCPFRRDGHKLENREITLLTALGEKLHILTSAKALNFNGRRHLLKSFINITRRKEAEKELRDYKEHLEYLVEIRTDELTKVNEKILLEIKERKRVEEALHKRLSMEELITVISTHFLGLSFRDIEKELIYALQSAGEFLEGDGCFLSFFNEAGVRESFYCWHSGEGESLFLEPGELEEDPFFLLINRSKKSNSFNVSDFEGSSPKAEYLMESFRGANITSAVSVPLISRNSLVGYFSAAMANSERKWEEEDVKMLKLAGAIFVNVMERKKAEVELERYSQKLEEMVEERTKELKDAHEKLVRQEKLAVLGQLAGGVAHELRNPLGAISNAVYFLSMIRREEDETACEYLELISSEIEKSNKIISDLLDFSRIKSIDKEEINVPHIAETALKCCAVPPDVKVVIDMEPEIPYFLADHQKIEQVLINLITNACQAMAEGGELTLKGGKGRNCVFVSVTDTGCGISEENLKKIFEPLFTTKSQGIGLGLAVCKNLIEANDGKISVKSIEGKGTEFKIIFPSMITHHREGAGVL